MINSITKTHLAKDLAITVCMYVSLYRTDDSAYYGEGKVHKEEDAHHQSDGSHWQRCGRVREPRLSLYVSIYVCMYVCITVSKSLSERMYGCFIVSTSLYMKVLVWLYCIVCMYVREWNRNNSYHSVNYGEH